LEAKASLDPLFDEIFDRILRHVPGYIIQKATFLDT